MKPRTEQFASYWDEHHQYPYFKKGKLKSYYVRKFYKQYFNMKNKQDIDLV